VGVQRGFRGGHQGEREGEFVTARKKKWEMGKKHADF
jgi:hypothetical protein